MSLPPDITAPEPGTRLDYRPAPATEPEHLTLKEVAGWLRCSQRTLERLIEDGSLPVIRLSERRLIFRLADLRAWLAQRTRGRIEPSKPRRRGRPTKATGKPAAEATTAP